MLPKRSCKKCFWRLDDSNYCLKRLQVISFKPKRCKDFKEKIKGFKINIRVDDKQIESFLEKVEAKKTLPTPTIPKDMLTTVETKAGKGIIIKRKTKISWWRRLWKWFVSFVKPKK